MGGGQDELAVLAAGLLIGGRGGGVSCVGCGWNAYLLASLRARSLEFYAERD